MATTRSRAPRGERRGPVRPGPPLRAADERDAFGIDGHAASPSSPIIHSRPIVGVAKRARTIDGMPTMKARSDPADPGRQRDPGRA